jgi:ketosteroid isomerase-like protein
LEKTSAAIRAAFARGDVEGILAYHHPDVLKGLTYGTSVNARDALKADLTGTLQRFNLQWQENRVESALIQGDTAVELTSFTIKATPKVGGGPLLFKGRAMVVYLRYKNSPTGWASIRELIQPATQ